MQDLQEVTHDLHYENYRATRLADGSDGEAAGINQRKEYLTSVIPRACVLFGSRTRRILF